MDEGVEQSNGRDALPLMKRPVKSGRRQRDFSAAVYVQLAAQLGEVPLITTDAGIASVCPSAELLAT